MDFDLDALPELDADGKPVGQEVDLDALPELDADGKPVEEQKKSLGIFGTLKAQTDAKAGREVGAVEAVAENLPVVGQVMDANYNRQWHNLKRLYEGDFNTAIEATALAHDLGFSDEDLQRINDEAGYGGRNLYGNYTKFDMEKGKALFKELVAPEFAKRLQVREQAQQQLNENDLNWVQKGVVGGVGATKLVGSMANTPLAMATLGIDATNRAAQLLEGKWVLDENGQPTKIWWKTDANGEPVRDEAGNLVPREELSQDMAVLKGITGAATERFIWMGLGKATKWLGAKAIGKMEQTAAGAKVSEALAKAASGTMKGVQEATEWLGKTSTGRAVLNVGKAIGWLNSKGKFGSIPDMMLKSRIQELADNVVGLAVADPADRESFSEWVGKFFSVKENAELFTEMLAMHLAMKAGGTSFKFAGRGLEKIGLKEAREFDRKSAIGRRVEETVAELVGEERAAKLTDKDLVNLYRIVTSDGFTAERAEQFAEKVAGDVDEAQKLIDEGASLSSLAEGLKARRQYSDQFVEGAKAAAAELRDRVTLDGAQSAKINDAALKAAEGNVEIAAKVAALAKAQLTNKHTQVDDADGLDSLVANAMRPFAPEARAVKIHDTRGNRNVGEQLKALDELGITSVEDAELNGVVRRDENGRLTGGARQAVNIAAHGTDALRSAVKDGSIDAATAEALITTAHTELGTEAPEARKAFIDGILERAKGDAALARRMAENEATEFGTFLASWRTGNEAEIKEELDGAADLARTELKLESEKGATSEISNLKLSSIEGGMLGCSRFRSMSAQFGESTDENGNTTKKLSVKGLGEGLLAKPGNWADGAVLLSELQRVAEKNGAVLDFGSVETATEAAGLLAKVEREGLEKAKAKLETRAKLVDVLARSALDTGVTWGEANFRKALAETSNGRQFIDNHGNIYGLKSADGTLHFNPLALDYNIPIHEYGHLALEAMKGVNRRLWERGMELVKESDYYRSIKEQSETEGHEYGYLKGNDAGICDEALAHLIGDNGEKLIEAQGVGAELKAWLQDFWKAFKGAFGLADMTEAQIEKLTLGQFVDAVNAELLRGKDFGERKATPLREKSIRNYDEADGSGSNGMLRWKNDRGRLFYIPVDMERTQPGGKVVLATDNANITDWIQGRLNGYTLRMSKKGNIYVEGRDGLEGELAEIFGHYPKAGMNDGIGEELASVLHNDSLREAPPDKLVEMLTNDRANYDEWVKATRDGKGSLEDAKLDEHYADEAERAEYEARRRWEDSGMNVPEYILSRIEDGEPGFDLEWETMREAAHDEAEGRFAARRLIDGRETAVSEGYPLSIRDARDPEKVLKVLSPIVGKSAAQLGEMKLTRINAESMEHSLNSKEAMHDRKDSSRKGKRLWRGRIGGLSVLDDLIATSPLGKQEAPNHFNKDWKKGAKFYRADTRFAVETEQGYEIYPCRLLVAELKNGERFVYDLVDVKEPTLSASAGSANLALPQGRTEESASSTGNSIANSVDGAQGGRAKFAVEQGNLFGNPWQTTFDFSSKSANAPKPTEAPKPAETPKPSEVEIKEAVRDIAGVSNRIEDVGEKIAGARKDILKNWVASINNATKEQLYALPFAKAFKKPDIKKAVENGSIRTSDADFYTAILSSIQTKKPVLTKRDEWRKRIMPGYTSALDNWVESTHTTLTLLKEFLELDETGRDKLISFTLGNKFADTRADQGKIQSLKNYNPDTKFGEAYTPNPIYVTSEVLKRVEHEIGESVDIPFSIKPNTLFDGYDIRNQKGEYVSGSSSADLEQAIDRLAYLVNLKRGATDLDHPDDAFKVYPGRRITGETGKYRVMWGGRFGMDHSQVFDSKEEAESFAQKHKTKPIPDVGVIGHADYQVNFVNRVTGEVSKLGDRKFATREEANEYLDQHRDEVNDQANEILAVNAGKPKDGGMRADDLVRVGWSTAAHTWAVFEHYKGNDTIIRTFKTLDEAKSYRKEIKDDYLEQWKKNQQDRKKFVYFDTGDQKRIGEDYREGKDVGAEDFMNRFGFRGVQFGNWANQADRQMALNQGYDALLDLAKIIGVPPKAISLNGELGIAFGARGSGSALAHYEPDEIVINLTKTKGAGSLAHEWWHALDNYFARAAGVKAGMVTDNSRIQMRKVLRDAYTQFTSEMSRSAYGKRSKAQGTYWGSMHEITARFFAEWVTSELAREGAQNTFLSHPMDSTRWLDYNYKLYEQQQRSAKNTPMSREDFAKTPEAYMGYPFPIAEDVNTFGALVRKIFDTIEVREEGEGDNKTLALFATARRNSTTDGQSIGDWIIGADGTIARRGTPQASMIGGARVADDAGRGEQTPGSMAAALERLNAPRTTMRTIGTVRPTSLPLSEMEFLRKYLTGDHLPAKVAKKIAGGKIAAHTKAGRLTIAADVFGLVDKTDVAPAKDRLKEHGFFRNEDEAWANAHSPVEIRAERERSENQLGDELLKLADRRARGAEAGGGEAARGVYANELAKIVMEMPRVGSGVIGRVQKIGDAVRTNVKAIMTEKGSGNAKGALTDEARQFLEWARGGAEPEGAAEKTDREITDEMFASWLTMPEEMSKIAPTWHEAILRTVAETPKLAEAFKELSMRALSKDSHRAVFEAVRKSQSREIEKALKELEADRTEKISAGSKVADAKEKIIVTFHDTLGAVAVRIDEKTRQYLSARRKVLAEMKARGATKSEIAAVENEIDIFAQKIGHLKNRMELSRTAMERGTWNEGRRYMLQYLLLENKATKKWGLTEEDKSAYLDMMRIVETQGRASSYGMDPRQARLALGDMARRLGAEKWARLEQYGREFFSVMEREFLNDPRVERMWGKGMIDYFRTQAHYVTTKRVHSQEELDAIETARAKAKAAGVNGGDDVIGAMFSYAGPRGGAAALGLSESAWTAKLTGSMGAKQEVRSATWEKQQKLMQSARRNQFVLDMRDALLAAKVEGVRDIERGEKDVKPGERYGTINYVENGARRTLIVPRQIADGIKTTPDNMPWLTKFHNAARTLMIDWNVAYWNRNVMRNSGSIEKNMPGMHETWLKTVLRVAPGLAPTMDLACQHLARHSKGAAKAMTALFGRDTIFPYIQQAGRMAKLLEDPTAWQERLWDAEARGDAAAVAEMHEDLHRTMDMLKGNMFLPTARAYGNRETQGFANDMMNKAGFRMVEQMKRQAAKSRFGRAVDLAKSPLERNRRQQEYEDVLAKTIAYLHDRAVYGAQRSVEESGLTVKRNVSIAESERKGTESRTIQRYMTQFFNMTEKGVMRTVRATQERPGETLGKLARTWVGRFVGAAMTYGLATRAIRALYGDDEEKTKTSPLGEVYDFVKWMENANRNLSNYVRNHYQTIPIWMSDDGYTTIVLGTPLNDEDSLLAPSADFAAKAFANALGAKNDLAIGQMLADTFVRPVTPDLAIATPALKVIRDTVLATLVENPTDLFTGAPTYDQDLYALRNESWEARGDFALAMARQVWNDVGARGFMAWDRQGVDNGAGAAPKWIGLVLKRIPILSPVLNSFVKIQVGSPEKDAKPVRADEQRLQHVRNYLSRKLMLESSEKGGALNQMDPQRYAELLEQWQGEYGLSDHDMRLVEKRFLNGWTEHENEDAHRRKVINSTLRKARRMGIDEADKLMIRGDL